MKLQMTQTKIRKEIYIITRYISRYCLRVCTVSASSVTTLSTLPTSLLDSFALVISVIDRVMMLLPGWNPMVSSTHIGLHLPVSDGGIATLIVPAGLHQRNEKEKKILADIKEKVEPVIEKIRPMLQADGGDIELVDVENDGTVKEVPEVKVVE